MPIAAKITIGNESFAVLAIEEGTLGVLTLHLDRPPTILPRRRESILVLEEGKNREPVRLCDLPQGTRLRVTRIY